MRQLDRWFSQFPYWGFKLKGRKLWTLRGGLNFAKEESIQRLEAEVDAMAVLNLMHDINTVNHPLGNISLDCRLLMMQGFEEISVKHIYRETNRCTDALAMTCRFWRKICMSTLISLVLIFNVFHADLVGVSNSRIVNA